MVFLFWKEPISYRMLLWIVCKLSGHLCGLICAYILFACCLHQRWSPRGHILKSLALASKVKSLASRPQVLENWPVLGSRTALLFELLKFCGALEKFFGKRFFCGDRLKIFFFWRSPEKLLWRPFFFGEHLRLCPWSLALASSIPVLGLKHSCPWPRECLPSERLSLASDFFVSLALASSLVSSTLPLAYTVRMILIT